MAIQSLLAPSPESIALPSTAGIVHWDDAAVLAGLAEIGAAQRRVEAVHAAFAAEVARRSHRKRGHAGLAARAGFARVGDLLQSVTGVSKTATGALVAAGELLAGAKPWLAPVARAVETGELSVAAGAAIASGLGDPGADVSADALTDVARELVETARIDLSPDFPGASSEQSVTSPEQVGIDARRRRAELDVTSVSDLDAHRFAKRSFRHGTNVDGTIWGAFTADPENGAIIIDAIGTITAPRRVEFRDAETSTQADHGADTGARAEAGDDADADADARQAGQRTIDPRTPAQRAFDAFISIIKLGVSTDDDHLFGHNDASIRVHVTAESLTTGDGTAWIEGINDLQPATTAQRIACTAGIIPIIFSTTGDILNVGRTQRLFTTAQRIALSARDGGCVHPGCNIPARYTEAHHTTPWLHGGNTNLADGILLCRFHHRMIHAQGYTITREPNGYWLNPPPGSTAPRRKLTSKAPRLT
jgi:hypothetical protein